jgi:hypothetical protein
LDRLLSKTVKQGVNQPHVKQHDSNNADDPTYWVALWSRISHPNLLPHDAWRLGHRVAWCRILDVSIVGFIGNAGSRVAAAARRATQAGTVLSN